MTAFAIDPGDVLLTFAEISVAFAGFSSIVAIFQRAAGEEGAEFDVFRFWVMLEFSLAALFFSLFPLVLGFLGLSAALVWSLAGGAVVLFVVAHGTVATRLIRRREPAIVSSVTRTLSAVANVSFSIIVVSQALNVIGIFGRTFGLYLVGLLMLLFGAALNFVRLVWVGNPSASR